MNAKTSNTQMVNLPIEYSDKQVTPFGGMSLLKRFLDKVEVKDYLQSLSLPEPGSNRGFDPSSIVQSFWLGIWTGISRYIHCDWLRYDKVLQDIFGLENFCMQNFEATEASFRFIMVAYNLISLFRHFALQKHSKATLNTIKSQCFALGSWTSNHANRKVLKIALPVKKRMWMDGLFSQIAVLKSPFSYSNA
ncbi:MAG: hypothetical protein LC134_07455 [Chitinophagales bacterium]|nr:hypothetical protein [Chitinophagales bacterium]